MLGDGGGGGGGRDDEVDSEFLSDAPSFLQVSKWWRAEPFKNSFLCAARKMILHFLWSPDQIITDFLIVPVKAVGVSDQGMSIPEVSFRNRQFMVC